MSERPVRTIAQIATAVDCSYDRADALVFWLWTRGLVEPVGAGYRRSIAAEQCYPVLEPDEVRRRQAARRLEAGRPGQCFYCARSFGGSGCCSAECEEAMTSMREEAA